MILSLIPKAEPVPDEFDRAPILVQLKVIFTSSLPPLIMIVSSPTI